MIRHRLPLLCRRLSSQANSKTHSMERIPLLEEIFEAPVLKTGEMRAESMAEIKGFVPPVLMSQIEESLTSEFGHPIMETDWSLFKDPTTSHEQAARLIHHTLAVYSNVGRTVNRTLADEIKLTHINEQWVKDECTKMSEEIKKGGFSRWEAADKLLGETEHDLTAAQMAAVRPALAIIGKNAWLHPKIKVEVVSEICKVIKATIKD